MQKENAYTFETGNSCKNAKMHHLGKWVTLKLKLVTKKLFACIKDLDNLIKYLTKLEKLAIMSI